MATSAHVDTFARDHLPPGDSWPELTFDLPELRYPDRLNCAEMLLAGVEAQRPCLCGDFPTWTYGLLRARANQIARVLTDDLGLVPGNRVLLRGANTPWLVACWFGILRAGGVVVTVLPALRPGELRTIIETAEISLALCDAGCHEDLDAAMGQCTTLASSAVLRYGDESENGLEARCAVKEADFPAVDTAADDVCLIAFTSGTTGRPKGCLHFHRDVLAIADTFSRHVLKPTPEDVFTGTPPLAFTFGLGALVVFPLRVGASVVLLETGKRAALLAAIERHRVTVLFTAPTAYRGMLDVLDEHSVSSLRRCVSAGEHLDAGTWRSWRERTGIALIDGIGATEMLHIFVAAADEDVRPGATGRAVPGFEAKIVDEEGRELPDGTAGLLAVRGPVGCRYLADERQQRYVREGWNVTGDTYVRDDDGYFWFRCRADDLIISAGYNIAAAEVEEVILDWPGVLEAAVVGRPDDRRGQVVTAIVVHEDIEPGSVAAGEQLKEFIRAQLAGYKCPRIVEFVAALPRNSTGKIQRFALRGTP